MNTPNQSQTMNTPNQPQTMNTPDQPQTMNTPNQPQTMNNSQLAHAWANQTKAAATASNFHFSGPTIYSYGTHFPIATLDRETVLFTSRTYGNSTAKHISHARRAIPHGIPVIYCHNPLTRNHTGNLETFAAELADSLAKYKTAKKYKDSHADQIDRQLANVRAYFAHFKTKKKEIPAALKSTLATIEAGAWKETPEQAEARRARQAELDSTKDARRAAARAARLAAEAEANAEKLARWKAGENVQFFESYGTLASLRVKNGHVETSQGARVTLAAALRLFRHITAQQTAPLDVDGFTFREAAEGIATISCHKIAISEMARIAPEVEAAALNA